MTGSKKLFSSEIVFPNLSHDDVIICRTLSESLSEKWKSICINIFKGLSFSSISPQLDGDEEKEDDKGVLLSVCENR